MQALDVGNKLSTLPQTNIDSENPESMTFHLGQIAYFQGLLAFAGVVWGEASFNSHVSFFLGGNIMEI